MENWTKAKIKGLVNKDSLEEIILAYCDVALNDDEVNITIAWDWDVDVDAQVLSSSLTCKAEELDDDHYYSSDFTCGYISGFLNSQEASIEVYNFGCPDIARRIRQRLKTRSGLGKNK